MYYIKNILTILFLFASVMSFGQARTVLGYDANNIPGGKITINSLVAKAPAAITTGGGTDTIGFTGNVPNGLGLTNRLPVWGSTSYIGKSDSIFIDSAKYRLGFGYYPAWALTFDSLRGYWNNSLPNLHRGGITFYIKQNGTGDTGTNYTRVRIYHNGSNLNIDPEKAGTYAGGNFPFINIFGTSFTASGTVSGTFAQFTTTNGTTSNFTTSNATTFGVAANITQKFTSSYTASSGHVILHQVADAPSLTSTATATIFRISPYSNPLSTASGEDTIFTAGYNDNNTGTGDHHSYFSVNYPGKITVWATNTAAGTTGNQTINKAGGKVNFAAGATSLVVTNSLVTTSSIIHATPQTNDANKPKVYAVVPAAGSFTIYLDPAPAGELPVAFTVIN